MAARGVVVGSVNVDLTVVVPALPGPGETALGRRLRRSGGGKGANAAVACAGAGAEVALLGAVGADDLGETALAELRAAGVDVSGVGVLEDEPTGTALIVVGGDGENQIAVGAGANAAVTAEAVGAGLRARADGCGCVLVSAEIPDTAVHAAVAAARAHGVPCLLNPAPARPALLAAAGHAPILTPNAGEARRLAVADDPMAAARHLTALTGAQVVVTLGADGAAVVDGDAVHRIPARAVRVVDTTGAGDAFNGVLAARLAAGDALVAAAEAAVAAASASVTRPGAR